jgi:hypothetical protein
MRSLFAVALLMASAGLAQAETVEVHPSKPVATLTVPDGWSASRSKRGLEIKTEDEEVYIWAETYQPNELKRIVAEHDNYWKDQGVVINGRDLSQRVEDGKMVQIVAQKATYEGKPTVLLYMEYDLGLPSKSNILITYWASPEGHDEHAKDVQAIIGSMEITEK